MKIKKDALAYAEDKQRAGIVHIERKCSIFSRIEQKRNEMFKSHYYSVISCLYILCLLL